jgi:all-trans-retinol dehydrogenase (NAD+)
LITGGNSGIGELIAKKMAKMGSTIIIWARNLEESERVQKEIQAKGGKCYVYKVDVSIKEEVYKTADKVKKEVGDVTILINNAGVSSGKLFLESNDDEILKTFQINILSHIYTTRAFLPAMIRKDHGHLVTIASAGGIIGTSHLAGKRKKLKFQDYGASKAAAIGFNEGIRAELREMGHSNKRFRRVKK